MSKTMNLHQVPEAMTLDRSLWAGRIMSAIVVIALVTDGTIQLFAPAQIASMLHETGFAMDLTRVVGPIILACAILYAIPATSVLGAILARLMQRFEDFAVAGVVFWAISLDFPWAWTRRVGSGLEPEFGAGRVCGLKGRL